MQWIGRYEVIRSLGQGGMGQVYLARDPKLERQVAIKLLHREDGPDARALFEREAKALAALNHPNIVTVFEIAEIDDGRQFIAMEYLPGRSLRALLEDRPTREMLVTICGQVAVALAAAHEAGILHRDIKPENVVVGKALAVKVVDFGIARRLDAPPSADPERAHKPKARAVEIVDMFTRTLPVDADPTIETAPPLTSMTRTVFGTPAYMAPEVLMGEPSSIASDTYSLGVMLYECLSGRRPYEAPQLHEIIARVVDGSDPPAELDDPLAPLVARMIAREPGQRPALTEIAKALARLRSAIAAPPPKRTRWWLALGAAVVIALAIGGILWSRTGEEAPRPIAAPRRSVALRPLDVVVLPSYGTAPVPAAFTTTLTALLDAANVPHAIDATLEIGVRIVEADGKVTALIDITEGGGHRTVPIEGRPDQIAELLQRTAAQIAKLADPDSQPAPGPNPMLAKLLLHDGKLALKEHQSRLARTYLEQAVLADPTNPEAWDRYAASLAMMAARRETMLSAAERAYQLAPEGPRKQILHGTLLIYRSDYPGALELLAPLEADHTLSQDDLRDLLFQLGECHWHEGRHDEGFAYFKRTLELDAGFAEAASHAGEYALARRDEPVAREYIRIQRINLAYVEFAMGRYKNLIDSPSDDFATWSRLVLGMPPRPLHTPLPPEVELQERIAVAAAAGDRGAVDRGVDVMLTRLEPFTNYIGGLLAGLGEVLVAAELAEPARRVLDALRTHQPTYNYRRLSILAAPLLGAPKFPRAQLTERLANLQTAIEAELAGDRAGAAQRLAALVANPTFEWDFVERLALRRNLLALGRTREAAALCADTLKPTTMRRVFYVVRARCLAR